MVLQRITRIGTCRYIEGIRLVGGNSDVSLFSLPKIGVS